MPKPTIPYTVTKCPCCGARVRVYASTDVSILPVEKPPPKPRQNTTQRHADRLESVLKSLSGGLLVSALREQAGLNGSAMREAMAECQRRGTVVVVQDAQAKLVHLASALDET